jgi:hypothetical protein
MLSGLWHQRQHKGHPFRNTVVRIPGPSFTAKRLISNIIPDMIETKMKLFLNSPFEISLFISPFDFFLFVSPFEGGRGM